MTRKELIKTVITAHPDWPPSVVEQAVRLVLDSIAQSLIDGQDVELRGLGAFRVRHYNNKTKAGKSSKYIKKRGLIFKPGLNIMRLLNEETDED